MCKRFYLMSYLFFFRSLRIVCYKLLSLYLLVLRARSECTIHLTSPKQSNVIPDIVPQSLHFRLSLSTNVANRNIALISYFTNVDLRIPHVHTVGCK